MGDVGLLVWLTQLGMSVALPLAGFLMLAVWLRDRFGWGNWVVWAGLVMGIIAAIGGFRSSVQAMQLLTKNKKKPEPPVSFNEHD